MTQTLEAVGKSNSYSEYKWDDGSDHDDVTKISVRGDHEGIQFIKFEYVKTGQMKESFHGFSNQGYTQMFEIDHLKGEHLISIVGYHNGEVIKALQFKTNLKTSERMGYEYGDEFTLAVEGKKIIGFHGSAKANLNSLGAYVTWIIPTKMEVKGGKGGKEWNDGADYEAVTKIHVRAGRKGIQNIKVDYVDKDGHPKEGLVHGNPRGGLTLEPFEINHVDNEYLLSAGGYYDETSGVIQAIQFKTNMKSSELMGFYDEETDTKFSLGCNGSKIIGFHGYAEKNLNSLGAYFTSLPIEKLEYKGTARGFLWDDGTFHGVRKVCVYYDVCCMRCVRFEYDNAGKVETREHGTKAVDKIREREFVLDYPNEFLTSVEGSIITTAYNQKLISSLTFKTSKGRTSPTFGNEYGSNVVEFKLGKKGCYFVGFHGQSTYDALYALGAYVFPLSPSHDGEKSDAQGGSGDDDGLEGV